MWIGKDRSCGRVGGSEQCNALGAQLVEVVCIKESMIGVLDCVSQNIRRR